MPGLTVKNIPSEVHRRLKARAIRHHRSLNSEVIACLQAAVMPAPIDYEAILTRARELRERVKARMTDADLTEAKREGRL